MGGGGTAPKMKMSDALILTGVTILFGSLFMHAWVTPVQLYGEDPPYTNGASMMNGDVFVVNITLANESTVRFVLTDESGKIADAESVPMGSGDQYEKRWVISDGGYYTYEIDTKGEDATLQVDIERKYMIDMLPFPIGAFLLAYGLYQRDDEVAEDESEVLDAELDA
ncbi:MAG: hypothetical protein L7U25_00830 [Candidatus Poseidonia sp.]|nr:hypothetical protein [Poseidonia sp.]